MPSAERSHADDRASIAAVHHAAVSRAAIVDHSPVMRGQAATAAAITASPRQAAQRHSMHRTGQVVQREVEHDGTKYTGNGDRAGWRIALKRAVIQEYNSRTGASLSLSTDLADEDLDRCHKISFNDIEAAVVKYCNGAMTQLDFVTLTNSLAHSSQANLIGKKRSFLASTLDTTSLPLSTPSEVCTAANALLSVLNSSIFNVMLGNARVNRSIQEQLDLHFTEDSSGQWSMTPKSKDLATTWMGNTSGIPYTPTGGHIKSSTSGLVPVGNLTPNTTSIVKSSK